MSARPRRACRHCRTKTTDHRLCDYPIAPGQDCDAKICGACSVMVDGKDLCPEHRGASPEELDHAIADPKMTTADLFAQDLQRVCK